MEPQMNEEVDKNGSSLQDKISTMSGENEHPLKYRVITLRVPVMKEFSATICAALDGLLAEFPDNHSVAKEIALRWALDTVVTENEFRFGTGKYGKCK